MTSDPVTGVDTAPSPAPTQPDTGQYQNNMAEALREAGIALTTALDINTLLDRLLEQVSKIVPYDAANIMLVEQSRIKIVRTKGYDKFGPEVEVSVAGLLLTVEDAGNLRQMQKTRLPQIIPDTAANPEWINNEASKHLRSWAGAPIVAQNKVIAFFSLDKIEPNYYQPLHLGHLAIFANQTGLAMENVRLFEAEARRRREAETLYKAAIALSSALDLQEVLNTILIQLALVIPYDSACVFLSKDNRLRAVAGRGFPGQTLALGQEFSADDALFQEIKQTRQPLCLANAQTDARFEGRGGTSYVKGWLGVPFIVRNEVIGYLTLDSRQVGAFTQNDTQLAEAFATQAAIAISNAQLFEQTQTSLSQTEALYQATQSLISSQDLTDLLQTIVDSIARALNADRVVLITLNVEQREVIHFVTGGMGTDKVVQVSFDELWQGLTGWVMRESTPAFSPKGVPDPRESPLVQQRRQNTTAGSMIVVPLKYRNETLGTLTAVNHIDQPDFESKDVDLMLAIANQAAIAVKNAQFLHETQQARQLSDSLRESGALLSETLDVSEVLERILDGLGKIVPYNSASVMLIKNNTLHIRAARGVPADSPGWSVAFEIKPNTKNYIICHDQTPLIIPDVRFDLSWTKIEGDDYIRSWLGVPLIVRDKTIGILSLDHSQPNFYTNEHVIIAAAFAQQAAVALENARLFASANQRVAELEAVRQATLSLTSSLELQAVLQAILESSVNLIPNARNAHIFLYQNQNLTFGASISADGDKNHTPILPRQHGLTYSVARKGQIIAIPDVANHPLFVHLPLYGQGGVIGLPLKIGSRVVGVMTLSSHNPHNWPDSEQHILQLLADQAAIAIENAWLYEKIQQQATDLKANVAIRTMELQTLYELAQALGQVNQLDEVINLVLKHLRQAIPYDIAASCLISTTLKTIVIQSSDLLTENVVTKIQNRLIEELNQANNLSPANFELHLIHPAVTTKTQQHISQISSLATAPIQVRQQIIGVILVAAQEKTKFGREQIRLLHTIADQAAETIGRLQLLLAAEQQRLDSLIAHLPNGVILLDTEHRIVLTNQVARAFLPVLIKVEANNTVSHIGNYPLKTLLASTKTESPFVVEINSIPPRLFEIDINPITEGPISGSWTLVIREVTQEQMIQKRIQQQERMAAVGQLAAGIAHDFNNILTSIIGYSELLLFEDTLPLAIKDDIERITKQGHRAAHLVRQILDFSRQTIAEKRSLDIAPFLKETIKLLERTLPENIHISLVVEPGNHIITADLTQLQQAITNLAVNARDAMPNGGKLEFNITRRSVNDNIPHAEIESGDWVVLSISDTGVGILPEYQNQIFEPFFTTKEVGKGTGLGLAQVYGIVKQHEGHIMVESTPNIGTKFTLYLPAQPTTSTSSVLAPFFDLPHGQNELVLLVEDDETVLDISTAMLKHLDYRIISATNGYEALQIFDKHQQEIALVLTDITMPQMGGLELTAALHKNAPALKVVALSGYPLGKEIEEFQAHGIEAWLQKPISLTQLAETLHRLLSPAEVEVKNRMVIENRIEVSEGNIVHQRVDAIVNAANSSLLGGGGVDGAIHRAAGPGLLAECRTLNGCPTGRAKITKGYNLDAAWVIHTVGPVWQGGNRDEDDLLAQCYRHSLALAVQHNIKTIAFPSISTGAYGFPIERAAVIAVREIRRFLETDQSLEKVVLVCFGQRAYAIHRETVDNIFGNEEWGNDE